MPTTSLDRNERATAAPAAEPRPLLRGWIHAATAPLALAAAIVLTALAPTAAGKLASAIYGLTALSLFGCSALYHRIRWSPRVKRILKRIDHSNIMLLIAGTYTPLSWFLLPRTHAVILLSVVWAGALLGVGFRVFFTDAPRWLYVPVYCALGLSCVVFLGDFFATDVAAAVLICVGGACYIAGAVVYGTKRPNPAPNVFGFHEIFHAFTVAGFTTHLVAVFLAVR